MKRKKPVRVYRGSQNGLWFFGAKRPKVMLRAMGDLWVMSSVFPESEIRADDRIKLLAGHARLAALRELKAALKKGRKRKGNDIHNSSFAGT